MRHILSFLSVALIALPIAYSQAANLDKPTIRTPVEGRHYTVLAKPGRTKAPPGRIEVVDFFWYGCPYCYNLLPYTEEWEKDKPSYVYVRKVPITGGRAAAHARAYYTSYRLNMAARLHRPIFEAIHKDRKQLNNKRMLRNFFASQGVDPARFDDIYDSFSVDARVRSAQKEVSFYQIETVPSFIINGKYFTDVSMAGSPANLVAVIKFLTEQEHQARNQEQG